MGNEIRWFDVRVADRRKEAENIYAFDLVSADGRDLPHFRAGAHLDIRVGEMLRQYSLCSSPRERSHYTIAVQREADGRGGSREICDTFFAGKDVTIRGPKYLFSIVEEGTSAVLMAGGIGIAPLIAMADEFHERGVPFHLHICSRSSDRMPFSDRIASAQWGKNTSFYYGDTPAHERVPLTQILGSPVAGRHAYVCGSAKFVANVLSSAQSAGWAKDSVHVERFSAPEAIKGNDKAFFIEIGSTGRIVEVPPGISAIEALDKAGVEIERSCNDGYCGTCVTKVLRGLPDHRDAVLNDEEHSRNDVFTPCCSRALSDVLVIDR